MQDGPNPKQQIVEKLKTSTNILVTVSANPSVDELSAALGLTLMLNKMDKHATAVFSGAIPPAIAFLDPEKTFEGTVDSLRDFIIALDKEKADRLRYKVDGDMVRIFITPYRTTITDKDLQFSQGDFNVEVIVALGVEQREDLDKAIVAHGRILHDAAVVTINAKNERSSLGSIDWQDAAASSLCEMLMSLSEALQPGVIDEQISTALLTGIVAATERFSNQHTSPRVMTMAAQLMAAGANQQLIATKLQQARALPAENKDGSTNLQEDSSTKLKKEKPAKKKGNDGEMQVEHEKPANKPQDKPKQAPNEAPSDTNQSAVDETVVTPQSYAEKQQQSAIDAAEDALADALPKDTRSSDAAKPSLADLEKDLQKERAALDEAAASVVGDSQPSESVPAPKIEKSQPAIQSEKPSWMGKRIEPPSLGGSLSATSEEALQEKLQSEEEDRNRTILSHDNKKAAPVTPALPPLDQSPAVESSAAPTFTPQDSLPSPELPKLDTAPEPQIQQSSPSFDLGNPFANQSDGASANAAPQPVSPPPAFSLPTPSALPAFEPSVAPPAPTLAQEAATPSLADQLPPIAEPTPTAHIDDARDAVNAALNAQPFDPSGQPLESVGAQPLSPVPTPPSFTDHVPDFSQAPEPNFAPIPLSPVGQDAPQTPPAFGLPTPPPVPDLNGLPPLPPLPDK